MTTLKLEVISECYMKFSVRKSGKGFIAPLLKSVHALKYMADCLDAGYELLGMSGFHYFDNGSIQPDQSFEMDVDDFDSQEDFLNQIVGIILNHSDTDIVFEIAFDEQRPQSNLL